MQTETIQVDRDQARELFRKYKEHRAYATPIDLEIERLYELIAKERVIIRAIASIVKAGLGADGLPKLAIARAADDQNRRIEKCRVHMDHLGGARFYWSDRYPQNAHWRTYVDVPDGSFPNSVRTNRWTNVAQVPLVPIHLRPHRGLANYHILWDAIWRKEPPVDPLLIRRIGRADLWVVVAGWDLTEAERAVLAGRL